MKKSATVWKRLFADANCLAEAQVAALRFRILVVDDEPLIRETARMILQGEGYEVLTACGRPRRPTLAKQIFA